MLWSFNTFSVYLKEPLIIAVEEIPQKIGTFFTYSKKYIKLFLISFCCCVTLNCSMHCDIIFCVVWLEFSGGKSRAQYIQRGGGGLIAGGVGDRLRKGRSI